ncbi:MAG: hypothetical protein P8J50_03700 [Acidimicrobiales bacterium]|nr:hypothetical protein [Acidimicrobiales bacterium]
MSNRARSDARRAAWMILGLLAIPFLSVTSVAIVADIASTTDPVAALIGIPATMFGAVVGALVLHLARSLQTGAVALWSALLRVTQEAGHVADSTAARLVPTRLLTARPAVVPVAVGRRGPPSVSR